MTRMISTALAATLASCTALISPVWADAGYTTTTMTVAHRDRDVDLHIWYPTASASGVTAAPETLGENAVFVGTAIVRDAPARSGAHPLVLLSHGSGGNAANLGWIAGELAQRGMIVAAPNHPGTTSRDSLQSETIKIWERPADLSAILDLALAGGLNGMKVDESAIAAMGFSLGGYTVMGIGGARVSKADYIDYCDVHTGMMDCGWLAAGGVDFHAIDQQRYEQSNHDPRITAIVSVDPALSAAFTDASLAQMDTPTLLINLGEGADVPAAVNAANLVNRMPNATLHQVPEATHFSFLGRCKRMASTLLRVIGEDPICTEAADRPRADIHQELQGQITRFLTRVFAKSS